MISFIIPTFEEEKPIAKMLESLRREFKLVPYEIIISDNQSTDKTIEQASPLADKVIATPAGPHPTIGACRNRGAEAAKYEYLVFLDSGVIIPNINHFFTTALNCFKKNERLLALTVKVKIYPETASFADKFFCGLVDLWYAFNNNITGIGIAYGKFQMIKTLAFKKTGGFDESLAAGEDAELFYRLSRVGSTRLETSLSVYHEGRRMHKIGWPKLLLIWMSNALWVLFFKKPISKEWKAIR